jgi:hypothetical protein
VAEDKQWEIKVSVPLRLPGEQRQELFAAVVGAVEDWEPAPAERDGWDADVAGCPADEWPEIVESRSSRQAWAEEAARLREQVAEWRALDSARDDAAEVIEVLLTEIAMARREVEFEANSERWANAVVGREGHGYVNGGRACSCGEPCLTIGDWERHLIASGVAEGKPLCSCLTAEQAATLPPGFSRPVCTVHPEGGTA